VWLEWVWRGWECLEGGGGRGKGVQGLGSRLYFRGVCVMCGGGDQR